MASKTSKTKPSKRLIVCCDGTWADSDNGYLSPGLIPYYSDTSTQAPSNVIRISRALTSTGLDGKEQTVYYHSGVGTGSNIVDVVAGGVFGVGISETIRSAYSFISTDYAPGDEIILIGFSRGAFTARSVAGLIRAVGLLTRRGMNDFYPIFTDQKNFANLAFRDPYPNLPFPNKPMGQYAAVEYKRKLWKEHLTRINDPDGRPICVTAIAVWDTVGSLGIPQFTPFARFGLPSRQKEYWFSDTTLASNTEHAFQALALDERRSPFAPAVWERRGNQNSIDLRQVWFPGAHKNVGGGYDDQGMANITLAWMMDQLASIGVGFQDDYIDRIFHENIEYYQNPENTAHPTKKQWAIKTIYEQNKPIRSFGLGKMYESYRGFHLLAGKAIRTPGLYKQINPRTGQPTKIAMTDTNERIHSSVRTRLQLKGLGPDDDGLYKADALTRHGRWKLGQTQTQVNDPIKRNASWGAGAPLPLDPPENDVRWVWEYHGPKKNSPVVKTLVEDNPGPYQRRLLVLSQEQGQPGQPGESIRAM